MTCCISKVCRDANGDLLLKYGANCFWEYQDADLLSLIGICLIPKILWLMIKYEFPKNNWTTAKIPEEPCVPVFITLNNKCHISASGKWLLAFYPEVGLLANP